MNEEEHSVDLLEVELVEASGPDEPSGVEERRDGPYLGQILVIIEHWYILAEDLVCIYDIVAKD